MSPTGRTIHEKILRQSSFNAPVRIGILETPTGFEVNAFHSWPERMEQFLKTGLAPYRPLFSRIRALRKDGIYSTFSDKIADTILTCDYLYAGAGSPSYTITHLEGSRIWDAIEDAHSTGTALCFGSATAIAVGSFSIPVYEIFKAGFEPYWMRGLNFFLRYGMSLAIVPHWNNTEGDNFDTTHCYMGKERFRILTDILPANIVIVGIDEITAAILDVRKNEISVSGIGSLHIIKRKKETLINSGESLPLTHLMS